MPRTPRFRSLAALAALALTLGLAGCGGDDDTSGDNGADSETAISKADFVEQGNAICADGNAEIAAAADQVDPSDPAAAASFVTDTLVPNIEGQLADLRELGLPEGDEDVVSGVLDDAEGVLDEVAADPSLLTGGDPFGEVNQQLIDYGLTECGS